MQLNIRPMRNGGVLESSATDTEAPSTSAAVLAGTMAAPAAPAQAVPQPESLGTSAEPACSAGGASTATPLSGRHGRAGARPRYPLPKRRGTAGPAGGRTSSASPAAPVTLDLAVRALAFGLKAVDTRLVRLQKSVDGLASVVGTSAGKLDNFRVLAQSMTTARGVTAVALALQA